MTKKAHLVIRMLENRIGYSLLLQVIYAINYLLITETPYSQNITNRFMVELAYQCFFYEK
jgi:hypothetical protein